MNAATLHFGWRRCAIGLGRHLHSGAASTPPGLSVVTAMSTRPLHGPATNAMTRTAMAATEIVQSVLEACQRPAELPSGGQQNCPLAARCSARRSVGQWRHPLSGGGLGEASAVELLVASYSGFERGAALGL